MSYPIKDVLVSIPKALQDELITDSGLKLYIAPDYNKEWQAAVTGVISSLPSNPDPKCKYILDQLKVGDEVCFNYQVVADFSFVGDGARFMPATEENPHFREFYNGKGESVRVYALPKRKGLIGVMWAAVYLTKRGDLIDGVQGDEETVERWLSQFPFGKTDIYTFNNFFEYEGQDYWRCGLDQIFAVKRKGHLIAVGDRILMKPIDEDVPDKYLIDTGTGQSHKVQIRYQDRGRVISGGKRFGIKKEDILHFPPNVVEKYEFYGKQYFLVNERMVLGKLN